MDGGPEYLLVVFEPASAEVWDGHRFEAQGSWRAGFDLPVDQRGELSGGSTVGPDAGPTASAAVVIAEVPDVAAEVPADPADAERVGFGHATLREPSRHKTPQTTPQTGDSEDVPKWQRPM